MMRMIKKFREATAQLHKEIEGQNLARYIMDHSMDMETYKLLLMQNYMAYKKTESEIGKYFPKETESKFQKLQQDLYNLEVELQETTHEFFCHSKAEAFGAAYVVEGSALGGMIISKNIPGCDALSNLEEQYFFKDDRQNLESWEKFKKRLAQHTFSDEEELEAIEKAKETFLFFGKVFQSA